MTHVITTQPASNERGNFLPLIEDSCPTALNNSLIDTNTETTLAEDGDVQLNDEKKERERRRSSGAVEGCCFALEEDDFLASYFCCRMLSDCLVGCGHCTESCCESMCNCEGEHTDNGEQNCDGCDCGDGDCSCGDCDCNCFD